MGTPAGTWPLALWLGLVLAADQAVKGCVAAALRERRLVFSTPVARIRPVLTHRTLAGRLGLRPALLSLAWLGCVLLVVLGGPHAGRFQGPLSQAALGAALGGAAGNLVDLFVRGGVVDYLEVGAWPAFNLADVAIVSGVIGALLAR